MIFSRVKFLIFGYDTFKMGIIKLVEIFVIFLVCNSIILGLEICVCFLEHIKSGILC